MCISASVGSHGHNHKIDVHLIQLLLNMVFASSGNSGSLPVDGAYGPATHTALMAFQEGAGLEASGHIEPGDPTMGAFHERLPAALTREKLWGVLPGASEAAIARYQEPLLSGMQRNGIDTPLRVAHFLAQVGHECADLRYQEEIASGEAYEGRVDLGNTEPGDGRRFKGRGLIQLTGRANYARYGEARGRDFLNGNDPHQIAEDPMLAVDVACWFWSTHNLNRWADEDNVHDVTRHINGGLNGLQDRESRLARAKWFLLPR